MRDTGEGHAARKNNSREIHGARACELKLAATRVYVSPWDARVSQVWDARRRTPATHVIPAPRVNAGSILACGWEGQADAGHASSVVVRKQRMSLRWFCCTGLRCTRRAEGGWLCR